MEGTLRVEEYDPCTQPIYIGERQPTFRTLGYWRKFTADGGRFPLPDGSSIEIPLDEWDQLDENTIMTVSFEWTDPKLIGTVDPAGRPSGLE